jgi:hypothetical protein
MSHPAARLVRDGCLLIAVSSSVACNNDPAGSEVPYILTPITTGSLAGTPGRTLAETLIVEVRTADGELVPGATVHWSLPQGGSLAIVGASLNGATSGTTDGKGRSYALWTLGLPEGTQQAKVAVGLGDPATFTATATALHVLAVSVGGDFVCAILTDNRPACWGANRHGQLGTGDTLSSATPVTPVGLTAVQDIQASAFGFTCARDMAGDVWCWGANNFGQAGPAAAQPMQLVPVRVAGAEAATSLAVSGPTGGFACAVLSAGGAKCWGNNAGGRLGTGDAVSSATPRAVVGSADFARISTYDDRACAVTTAREVWCWGNASAGEFAPYPAGSYFTPIQPIPGSLLSEVELTYAANCGLGMSGEAICWGNPLDLGLGTIPPAVPITSPVRPDADPPFAQVVSDGSGLVFGRTRDGQIVFWGTVGGDWTRFPTALQMSVRAEQVAAGSTNYCIIAESGALYCDTSLYWFDQGNSKLQAMPAP